MKLDQYAAPVKTQGITSRKMRIEANAKAFSILLDRLYPDIKYAIVRELLTNGFDAHKEAGCPERPMMITIPSKWNDQMLVFRDYGVSMSDETVDDIYATLMASTKDESDDAVGGWGVGSKTPFGYSKHLSLRCFKEGRERLYQMFFDGDSVPNIALIHDIPTSEETGVEISFAVRDNDLSAFCSNIVEASVWFETPPITSKDIGVRKSKYVNLIGKIYKMEEAESENMSGLAVRQGCVGYPLDDDKLIPTEKSTQDRIQKARAAYEDFNKDPYFIDVPVGTCDVTASRDSLYYSDKTIDNIVDILCEVYEITSTTCKEELDKATTLYEARRAPYTSYEKITGRSITYGMLGSQIVKNFFADKHFENEPVHTTQTAAPTKINDKGEKVKVFKDLSFAKISLGGNRTRILFPNRQDTLYLKYNREVVVVFDQMDMKSRRYAHKRCERMAVLTGEYKNVTLIWCQVSGNDLSGFNEFWALLGKPPLRKLSEVELPIVEKEDKEPTPNKTVYRSFTANKPQGSKVTLDRSEIDEILESESFMYMNTFWASPASEYELSWDDIYILARLALDDTDNDDVIMVTKSNKPFFAKHLKDKTDYVSYLREKLVTSFELEEYCRLSIVLDQDSRHYTNRTLHNLAYKFFTDGVSPFTNNYLNDALTLKNNAAELKCRLYTLKEKLERVMKCISEEEKEKLRKKIENGMEREKFKNPLKLSDLDERERQIIRKWPWLMGVVESEYHSALIDHFNHHLA